MSERVTMPALGESVTEGTVTRWLKNVGERVEVDEPLVEVSTDKVDTEIPSPFAGVLEQILVGEDETVEVGADLALIGDGSGAAAPGPAAAAPAAAAQEPAPPAPAAPEPAPPAPAAPEPPAQAPAPALQDQDTFAAPSTEQPVAPATSEPEAAGSAAVSGGQTVTMPALGESVTEGTVTRWLKQQGEHVEVDEPLVEVSTDKVDTEIPSPYAGVISAVLVGEDETVEVGAPLAVIGGEVAAAAPAAAPAAAAQAPPAAPPPPQPAPSPPPAPPRAAASAPPQPAPSPPPPAPSAPAPPPAAAPAPAPAAAAPPAAAPPSPTAAVPSEADDGVYVTPLVRKLAAEHGVSLSSITGTGIGGRIRKQDVLDAAAAAAAPAPAAQAAPAPAPTPAEPAPTAPAPPAAKPAPSPKRGTTEKMSRLRKVIAQRMVESLQVSAQLTTVAEVDLTKVAWLRARAKDAFRQREGASLSYLPFLALAAVEALKVHPIINASVEGDSIVYHGQENLSIAVDTNRGLIVPVIHNAGDLNIAGLARAIADVAERTRTNKITPDDLAGGTFTISNTGSRGALFDTPIINQPQVAILGTGGVVKRPIVLTGSDGTESIAVRSMMMLALSYDHRIVDGADASRFLMTMVARLEEGGFEADLGL